jgi:transcription elongation factor Elf1
MNDERRETLDNLAPQQTGEADIRPTDIVFDCPHCGKNLCIDYHGAGLMVPCPGCSRRIQVPIPEGMDIADFDSTEEELRVRLIHMREALIEAQTRLAEQQQELVALRERVQQADQRLQNYRDRLRSIHEECARMKRDVMGMAGGLDRMVKISEEAIHPAP